jgi:5-methylcytosine-specific restriction protein A
MKTNRRPRPQARNKINDQRYQKREWKVLRVSILQRDGYKCAECAKRGKLKTANTVDHIVQVTRGGSFTDPNNLQSLCASCHAVKSGGEKRF